MKMKTMIVYATKYGCTEKCAAALKEQLTGEIDLVNLKSKRTVDLTPYGNVIIGGSIYMGGIQKEVKRFCSANLDTLMEKKLGLFICCMREGDIAETELTQAFPPDLLLHAVTKDYFGGEFIFHQMGLVDRFIARKVSKADGDISTLSKEKLQRFAHAMS